MVDIERTKLEVQLRNQQRVLNKKFAEEGLTDEIKESIEKMISEADDAHLAEMMKIDP